MKRESQKDLLTAKLSLNISGEPLNLTLEAPKAAMQPIRMLPVFRKVCGDVVGWSVKRIEREGRSISCKAGCGACCRQMVPISKTEARRIAEIIDAMPTERRDAVIERFSNAIERLADADLIDALRSEPKPTGSEYKELGLAYFHLGIRCPFLENESCSIHAERPLVCREYLVVSPAENCSRTNGQSIEVLKMPVEASKALAAIDDSRDNKFDNWVPLVLALEWAKQNTDNTTPSPGTDIAARFMSALTGIDLAERPSVPGN